MTSIAVEEVFDKLNRYKRPTRFPCTLTRKGMYILPTRMGLMFILVLFVMLIGAINYNNNLAFLFTFLLAAMAFISLLHTHRAISGLTLVSASVAPVTAGDTAEFTIILRPESRIRMGVCLNFHKEPEVQTNLTTSGDQRVSIRFHAEKRGLHTVKALIVSSSYPFGLFRTWATVHPGIEYLVYPKALPGPFNPSEFITESDTEGRNEVKGSDDFRELRPYRPGDPMSRLSWKSLAKGKGLYTKEFERLAGASVMLAWDSIIEAEPEKRISRLTDMVHKAHLMNLSYGLSIPGVTLPPAEPKDPGHLHQCLKELALLNTGNPS